LIRINHLIYERGEGGDKDYASWKHPSTYNLEDKKRTCYVEIIPQPRDNTLISDPKKGSDDGNIVIDEVI
jgi:hypothetical protein